MGGALSCVLTKLSCICLAFGFKKEKKQGQKRSSMLLEIKVVPDALKVLRLQAGHKYCLLVKLSSEVGWNHYDTIREFEKKRKERAQVAYERKMQLTKLRVKAEKAAEEKLGAQLDVIAPIKY